MLCLSLRPLFDILIRTGKYCARSPSIEPEEVMNFNVYLRACLSDDSKENSGERIIWRGIDGSVERRTGGKRET